MDQQRIYDVLSGRRRGAGAGAIRALLLVGSGPYRLIAQLRRRCYRAGLLPASRAAAAVISVGNITVGGTGKTPMVAWVVDRLVRAGASPAILTRGYGAAGGVSDEAEVLRKTTARPVIVNPDRRAGAARAVALGADVLVMDDGFQHRALARDLDIVLIDATRPFGFGHCLPRGLLREPPGALIDADAIVITHSDEVSPARLAKIRRRLKSLAPKASQHTAIHSPTALLDPDGRRCRTDALAGRRVLAFCGVGNPDSFFAQLRRLDIDVVCGKAFEDHAAYGDAEIGRLRKAAAASRAEAVLTTQKDFVKIADVDLGAELWQITVEMEVTGGGDELAEMVIRAWRSGPAAGPPDAGRLNRRRQGG